MPTLQADNSESFWAQQGYGGAGAQRPTSVSADLYGEDSESESDTEEDYEDRSARHATTRVRPGFQTVVLPGSPRVCARSIRTSMTQYHKLARFRTRFCGWKTRKS